MANLLGQQSKRNIFYKTNIMRNRPKIIIIEKKLLANHLGYPISEENLDHLNNHNSSKASFRKKGGLKRISSKKIMMQLKVEINEK